MSVREASLWEISRTVIIIVVGFFVKVVVSEVVKLDLFHGRGVVEIEFVRKFRMLACSSSSWLNYCSHLASDDAVTAGCQ